MASPQAPGDDFDAGLEGGLGRLTDAAWLDAHRDLIASGALPEDETAYLYDPDRDPATVHAGDLTPGPDPKEPEHG